MAIFLDPPKAVVSPNVFALWTIVNFDGQFDFAPTVVLGTQVIAITSYLPTVNGFGQTRIASLVALPNRIVLSSVNSTFTLPDGSPITKYGAAVLVDADVQILVWDQQGCGGSGYHFCGPSGDPVPAPSAIIVAHELAHAFHNAIGDAPGGTFQREVQASQDENQHRQQLGLPLRDPGNRKGDAGPAAKLLATLAALS